MPHNLENHPERKLLSKTTPLVPRVHSAIPTVLKKSDRPQTFTKVFRWRPPAGQTREPASVEVIGTFTHWRKVPLTRDSTRHEWQVTLHDIPCNRTHHYMMLADDQPVKDENSDGLAVPHGPQEEQYALQTFRGPRLFMLFAQAK